MKLALIWDPGGPRYMCIGSKYVGAAEVAKQACTIVALLSKSLSTLIVSKDVKVTSALLLKRFAHTKLLQFQLWELGILDFLADPHFASIGIIVLKQSNFWQTFAL